MHPSEITKSYLLTAGETDAESQMPIWLIVSRIIEVATEHANILGVGYDDLIKQGIGWVLTRLSAEISRYPAINEYYSITSWVEGFNRLYSDRCFHIADADGNIIANIRSTWVGIDIAKRSAADLSALDTSRVVLSEPKCPVSRTPKQKPLSDEAPRRQYTFTYSDLDFNRHVNTVQYVRHILDQWPLEMYDTHEMARFDIVFHNECHYGESVCIKHIDNPDGNSLCEIINSSGHQAVTSAVRWRLKV